MDPTSSSQLPKVYTVKPLPKSDNVIRLAKERKITTERANIPAAAHVESIVRDSNLPAGDLNTAKHPPFDSKDLTVNISEYIQDEPEVHGSGEKALTFDELVKELELLEKEIDEGLGADTVDYQANLGEGAGFYHGDIVQNQAEHILQSIGSDSALLRSEDRLLILSMRLKMDEKDVYVHLPLNQLDKGFSQTDADWLKGQRLNTVTPLKNLELLEEEMGATYLGEAAGFYHGGIDQTKAEHILQSSVLNPDKPSSALLRYENGSIILSMRLEGDIYLHQNFGPPHEERFSDYHCKWAKGQFNMVTPQGAEKLPTSSNEGNVMVSLPNESKNARVTLFERA